MKKTLSIVLSILIMISAVSGIDFSAFAATSGNFGNLTWNLNLTTGLLKISGSGDMIRNEYIEDDVTYLENVPWYDYKDNIKNVDISEGINSICSSAFLYCRQMSSINVPSTVTKIGEDAFGSCENLNELILPEGLIEIGNSAFGDCESLEEITIPESVEKIGTEIFGGCYNLKTVNWCARDAIIKLNGEYAGLFYDAGKDVDGGLTLNFTDTCESIDGSRLFTGYVNNYVSTINIGKNVDSGSLYVGSYIKNTTVNYYCEKNGPILETLSSVTQVGTENTYSTKSCYLNIGDNVKTINGNWYTFATVNLDSSQIVNIAKSAFYNYTTDQINKILSDDLESVKTIGERAFYYSEISFVPKNVEVIGDYAFNNCKNYGLQDIRFSSNLKEIGYKAFTNSQVNRVFYEGTVEQWQNIITTDTGLNNKITICSDGVLNCSHSNKTSEIVGTPPETVYTCQDCGSVLGTCENQALHSFELVESKEPTCEKDGYIKYVCTVCNKEYIGKPLSEDLSEIIVDSSEYPESLHNYANNTDQTFDFLYNNAVKLMIQFSGDTSVENNYDYIYIYGEGDVLIGKYTGDNLANKTLNIDGNYFKIILTSDSSNVDYGFSISSITALYHDGSEEYNYLSATGHDYSVSEIIEPQCSSKGYSVYTCSKCGKSYIADYKNETGLHSYVETVTQATSTSQGYTAYTCSVCGDTYNTDYFDAATVYSDIKNATAGETIKIPVSIKNNTGILGWKLTFDYDEDVLTPVSVESGDVISGGLQDNIDGDMTPGSINVYWAGSDNEAYNGIMFYINFEVSSYAFGNTTVSISYSQEDTFDTYFNDVYLNCEPINLNIANDNYSQAAKINASAEDVTAGDDLELKLNISEISGVTKANVFVDYNSDNFEFKSVTSANGTDINNTASNGRLLLDISGITEELNNTDFVTVIFKCKDKAMSGDYDFTVSSQDEGIICKGCSIKVNPSATSEIAEIYADDVTANYNDEITIPVYIDNNHGIMGYRLDFAYDANLLEPVSAKCGADFSGGCQFNDSIGVENGKFKVIWNNVDEKYENGILLSLTFKVLADEKADTSISMTYSQPDTFNEKYEDVVLNCKDINVSLNNHQHSYTAIVTDPTCTENGYTTYTCSCGDSYVADEKEALGHCYGQWTYNGDAEYVSSSSYTNGTQTRTCTVCGETETIEAPNTALLRRRGNALELESAVKVNVFIAKTTVDYYDEVYAEFDFEGDIKNVYDFKTYNSTYYQFDFEGIAPQRMSDTINITFYGIKDGVKYWGNTYTYSITDYLVKQIGSTTNENYKTMLVDLLYYGAACQTYQNYKTDSLMTDLITDEQKACRSTEKLTYTNIKNASYTTCENRYVRFGTALRLYSAVEMAIALNISNGIDINDLEFKVQIEGRDLTYSMAETPENFAYTGGYWYFYFDGVYANQLSSPVYITAYMNGEQVSYTLLYSVESYAATNTNTALQVVLDAMMHYGNSAKVYAGK